VDESGIVGAATALTRDEFVSRFAERYFLVRREPSFSLTRTMPMTPQSIKSIEETLPSDHPRVAPRRVWALAFGGAPLRVGRDGDCDVPIQDRTVSRLHATIVRAGERIEITDHGARNGTMVGGVRIHPQQPVELACGATVRFGSVELVFADSRECWQMLR